MGLILGSCALTACSDAPFVYDPQSAPLVEAGPTEDAGEPQADAAPDRDSVGLPRPDAGRPPPPDAGPSENTDAAPETDAGCAPAPLVADCIPAEADAGVGYSIPGQYCVWLYDQNLDPPAAPVIMPMPAACACNYTEGCLTGSNVNLCPAGSKYYGGGIFADDAGASRVVCQQEGDGG
jgi:hypothetical protein